MSDDIVTRLRKKLVMEALGDKATYLTLGDCLDAADEIERLRELAKALYDETKRCGSKHDVKATNDWEEYDEAVRGE